MPKSGVPKPGCFKRGCLQFYAEALLCARLRPFALFCARKRSSAHICVFLPPTAFRMTTFGNCRTLPALQKTIVDFLLEFAWKYCVEKWRGFLVNFFWSPFPTKGSSKTPEKIWREIRGKIQVENSRYSGNFRSAPFSDLEIVELQQDRNPNRL